MRDHRVPTGQCPHCGYEADGAMNTTGNEAPEPGDYTVCIDCMALNVFSEDLTLRMPTPAEAREIAGDPRLLQLMRVMTRVRKAH